MKIIDPLEVFATLNSTLLAVAESAR